MPGTISHWILESLHFESNYSRSSALLLCASIKSGKATSGRLRHMWMWLRQVMLNAVQLQTRVKPHLPTRFDAFVGTWHYSWCCCRKKAEKKLLLFTDQWHCSKKTRHLHSSRPISSQEPQGQGCLRGTSAMMKHSHTTTIRKAPCIPRGTENRQQAAWGVKAPGELETFPLPVAWDSTTVWP